MKVRLKLGNSLLVTIEDPEKKINSVTKTIKNIKEVSLVKELPDGTKQYSITPKDDNDIRKEIFEIFAKNGITIFELKKSETTLEDAFIDLIDKQKLPKEKEKTEDEKKKYITKEKSVKKDSRKEDKKKEGGDK